MLAFMKCLVELQYLLAVTGSDFFALVAEAFWRLFVPESSSINELYLAFTLGRLFVAQNPDVRIDTGIVKQLVWQGDDGFEQIFF